ncbi:hypothetical protein N7509_009380 [Penicillium cosmopolitanum]|uniref:Uncharacterized protein n=1 Tax=Penicillium cosmopolitanum TaxID=1131564 RepID=A0A9X0B3J2_9EURO|nr:uncharacterized protein N7509_009380 [Penicillium cosmopolitanum]KAJ5386839.1 hypothetical protein N7509_009380 [Penicillium cosmopolitanum]
MGRMIHFPVGRMDHFPGAMAEPRPGALRVADAEKTPPGCNVLASLDRVAPARHHPLAYVIDQRHELIG